MLAALERERRVAQQLALADPQRDVVRFHNGTAAARRIDEAESEPLRAAREQVVLGPDARTLLLQARDLRQLRLCLLGFRLLVPEARNEPLETVDVDRDAVGGLRGMGGALGLLPSPRVPRAGEIGRLSGLELERRVRDRLQKPPVVRDEDHAGVERRELSLEPLDARHVEVVRGLVEE